MAAIAMAAENTPTQVEEGLQQIFQQLLAIKRSLGVFEEFGEVVDTMQQTMVGMQMQLNTVETTVQQVAVMLVQIGNAVTGLYNHQVTAQQVVAQQMEMAGAVPPQGQHSSGDPWQAHAEGQPPPPNHSPPGWGPPREQGGAPTTQTTTTGQPVSPLLHELGTIPEEGPVLNSPEWEILPDQL
eukprot:4045426-Pyramimonas_sp.AAC.1